MDASSTSPSIDETDSSAMETETLSEKPTCPSRSKSAMEPINPLLLHDTDLTRSCDTMSIYAIPINVDIHFILPSLSKPFKIPTFLRPSMARRPFFQQRRWLGMREGPAVRPRHDPDAPGALVLEHPPELSHSDRLLGRRRYVPVVADPVLARQLRPHQRDGVRFLYRALREHGGAVLADDLGLGKTLQTIVVLWTLLHQSTVPFQNTIQKAILVTPATLGRHWATELEKWVGHTRCPVLLSDSLSGEPLVQALRAFVNAQKQEIEYPLLILSYEALRIHHALLSSCPVGLVVCDEGHRLKNANSQTFQALQSLSAAMRLVVSGTPLETAHAALLSWACPHLPPTLPHPLVLRRRHHVLVPYLPAKHDYVVFVRLTPAQQAAYRQHLVRPKALLALLQPFKLPLLAALLRALHPTREKIVLVSHARANLDRFQTMLQNSQHTFLRVDGACPPERRHRILQRFNDPESPETVLVLSGKAGGLGLNLTGASRLILYDPDWNPASDLQALARVWRDGQTKPCYTYRFIATGTIEEKILQRQYYKLSLNPIELEYTPDLPLPLPSEKLPSLSTFNEKSLSDTHDSFNCRRCVNYRQYKPPPVSIAHDLSTWHHYSCFELAKLPDAQLRACAKEFVTYVFHNETKQEEASQSDAESSSSTEQGNASPRGDE